MRVIKPGRIGKTPGGNKESQSRGASSGSAREIWDDFLPQKATKKREYERGAGNRMVPRAPREKKSGDGAGEGVFSLGEGRGEEEPYQPSTDYRTLEEKLGYEFKDREILSRALTHRSALGLKERSDYERLEFLGDAVLDLSVAHLLSDLHPEAREGELSKMRAALVNTQALAEIARILELGPFIRLGRGELSSGGAERPSILADVMEAVIGAIYRDGSYEEALGMISRVFGSALEQVTPFDPKTELQEVLHAAGSEPPSYLLELVEGPEHAPTFVTVVVVDGEVAGRGRGATKKSAQQEAAAQALSRMTFGREPLSLSAGQAVFLPELLLVNRPAPEAPVAGDAQGAT